MIRKNPSGDLPVIAESAYVDKTAIIHCPMGKASFGPEKLAENMKTLMDAINKAKPATAKGIYVRSLYISATMGPAVKVNPLKF